MRAESVNRFFNEFPFVVLITAVLIITASLFAFASTQEVSAGGGGLFFSSERLHIADRNMSLCLNLAAILATGALIYLLNKSYMFIRSVTLIHISSFFLLEAANPYLSASLLDGSLLCVILFGSAFILFNTYQERRPQRSIFLTFAILALGAAFQYVCLYLIPVFLLGFMQMRAMSLKGFLATGIGLITPYWILFGFGIITLGDFNPPAMVNVWESMTSMQSITMLSAVGITTILLLVIMAVNLIQIYGYKAKIRAYNGFFTILALATMIIMAVDYGNILNYLPILNCCLAIHIGHAYSRSSSPRRFIPYAVFMAACVASFLMHCLSANIANI